MLLRYRVENLDVSSTFLVYITPLETFTAKCICLSKCSPFREGNLQKCCARIQLMIVLAEETNDSFATACTWTAFLDGI